MNDYASFLPILLKDPIYLLDDISVPKQEKKVTAALAPTAVTTENIPSIAINKIPVIPVMPAVEKKKPQAYKVLVLCNTEINLYKDFLGKILAAVKLDMKDVAMVQTSAYKIPEDIAAPIVLTFGIKELPPFSKLYDIVALSEFKVMHAHALNEIEATVANKRLLWNELQKLFI